MLASQCALTACGCSKGEESEVDTPQEGTSVITLSPESVSFEAGGGSRYVTVSGPDGWAAEMESGESWCSFTKDSGNRLTVKAKANDGGLRTAAVVLKAGSATGRLSVSQDACEKIIENDILPANNDYTVEILRSGSWKPLFVHNAKVSDYAGNPEAGYTQYDMGFVMFTDEFKSPVRLRITRSTSFSKVEIRPKAYGITPVSQSGKIIEIEIPAPEKKISVEFDGDRMRNLFIFPDLPESDKPSGPGVTYFGPGVHNVGLISPKSGQTIYIDEGAVVLGRIKAENASNLTIAGRGILCGSRENHGDGRLPQIELLKCDNLKIEGIMLRDSPNWTIKMTGCKGVHIDNIKEISWIMNSDGMDFICCRNVVVENTFQRNYDDNVTIKAFNAKPEYIASHTDVNGSYTDGTIWMVNSLTEFDVDNIEVRNCVFWADKAHNMVVGPESRGIPFTNIRFIGNTVLENRQNDSVYPGTMAVMIADNGTFSDIRFEDINVEDINGGKVICVHFANAWAFDNLYGQWARNIVFRNVTYNGTRATKSWVRGLDSSHTIDRLTVSGLKFNGAAVTDGNGNSFEVNPYVKNVIFE